MPDFSTYAWNQLGTADGLVTVPDARWGHAMVWDGSRIIMYGGQTNRSDPTSRVDETWEFDGTDWNQLSPATTPGIRSLHSMIWDGTRALMFGGLVGSGTATTVANDIWEFDGSDWTDISPGGTEPTARMRHTAVWDGTRMLIYGGTPFSQVVKKDTWKFESGSWTQLTPTNYITAIDPPPGFGEDGRAGMRSAWDGSRVVVFSGFSDGGGGGEFQTNPYYESGGGTWQYESNDWTQVGPATNPQARWGQGFCVTDDDQKILMFGGNVSYVGGFGNAHISETWVYDGTDWDQLGVSGPSSREGELIWDDAGARAILFGGRTGGGSGEATTDETWEFATTVAPAETIKAINNTFGLG